jgi:hypothetical protein
MSRCFLSEGLRAWTNLVEQLCTHTHTDIMCEMLVYVRAYSVMARA